MPNSDDTSKPFVKNEGTSKDPMPHKMIRILKFLIDNPRGIAENIKKNFSKKDQNGNTLVPGATRFKQSDIESGPLSELITFRTHIKNLRNLDEDKMAGTSFIHIKLHDDTKPSCRKFERKLIEANISGVIEWDLITGDYDYMIRVVRKRVHHVKSELQKIMDYAEIQMGIIDVVHSGVIDNFEPDDFIFFHEPKPPRSPDTDT